MSYIKNYNFRIDNSSKEFQDVQIKEVCSTGYSNFVWPSALAMCQFICKNRKLFQSKTLLELGSGTGICSIVAAKIGSKVIVTDKFDNKLSLNLCEENLNLNYINEANVIPLHWGNIKLHESISKVNGFIASDCFYDELDFENLFSSISLLFEEKVYDCSEAELYFAYHIRSPEQSLECMAKKWNLLLKSTSFKNSKFDQIIQIYKVTQI